MQPEKPSANSESKRPPPWRGPWPLWRLLMLCGSVILLANALAKALIDAGVPRPIDVVATAAGFVLLAAGFGARMRSR